MKRTEIPLKPLADGRMIGMRAKAVPVRAQVASIIERGEEVVLDFEGIEATQSFVDELVGALILRLGPKVLTQVVFRNCSPDVRAIVKFVAADRVDQFSRMQH